MVARGWPEGFGRYYPLSLALGNCLFGCTNNAFARLATWRHHSSWALAILQALFHLISWLDIFLAELSNPGIWEHVFQLFCACFTFGEMRKHCRNFLIRSEPRTSTHFYHPLKNPQRTCRPSICLIRQPPGISWTDWAGYFDSLAYVLVAR